MKNGANHKPASLPAWKVVWKSIVYYKKLWLANWLAMMITMLFIQIPALALREFFNLLSGSAQLGLNVWSLVALLFLSEMGSVLGVYGLTVTNVPFFMHVMTLLRKNLLAHILRRPGASALPDSPGEAISRFRGDTFEIPLFALWMNDLMGSIAFNIISLIVMIQISPTYTALALLPFIAVGFIAASSARRIDEYRRASSRATGIITGFIGEFFGAVQAVKVATAEAGVIGHFKELNEERRVLALRDRLFNEILNSIFHNASSLGTGVILILAGQAMQAGSFTVGDFALFVFYLDFLSELTAFSGLLVARYRQIGISIERMQRLMEGAPVDALIEYSPVYLDGKYPSVQYPAKDEANDLRGVEARNLSYHFPATQNGIRGVNLRLPRGSFTVVTGRIGSGKTTLLRVLLGLLPMDEGGIYWNGQKWKNPASSSPRPTAPTPHRCRVCSATRCATTS
jgi:ATP-binding cassette, subfamily B, bacterial